MHMGDPKGGKMTPSQEIMQTADVIAVIMDRIVTDFAKNAAKFPCELDEMIPLKRNVKNLSAKLLRLLIKDPGLPTCNKKVHLRIPGRMRSPKSEHLHQPRLRSSHAKRVDNLEYS